MPDIVLDASALLAVLRSEQGAEEVEQRLEGARIGAVNLSDVVAKLSGDGASEAQLRLASAKLELDVRAFAEEQAYARAAAWLDPQARTSFGDRASRNSRVSRRSLQTGPGR